MGAFIPRDVQEFLDGYPDLHDYRSLSRNLRFYSNELRCQPDCKLISEIHEEWLGDYSLLETKHGYIQWLFPIREDGLNYAAQPLQKHEIKAMTKDDTIMLQILTSYKLMLDFYGMRLENEATGLISRSKNYTSQYKNLCRSSHNNLRISRILKCLSEFGYEHLNYAFLLHVLNEQSEHGQLNTSIIRHSMDRWWANCVRGHRERDWINEKIVRVRNRDVDEPFVFTREMYEAAINNWNNEGRF
ncbi:hypothetical protein BDM02DRAFT_3104469 [Thelephora ganbajun]|uniref:Uncharacterized protein n=1 Tax=Thelephora ganbajun TaxID=370292 RepID=A0ACB6Z294_THEGA|nr:hypothetical protein BDM02DRAFT_3104469 [Thelephora ganbajun]